MTPDELTQAKAEVYDLMVERAQAEARIQTLQAAIRAAELGQDS